MVQKSKIPAIPMCNIINFLSIIYYSWQRFSFFTYSFFLAHIVSVCKYIILRHTTANISYNRNCPFLRPCLLCRILSGEDRGVTAGLDWNCQDISELCDSPESEWQFECECDSSSAISLSSCTRLGGSTL